MVTRTSICSQFRTISHHRPDALYWYAGSLLRLSVLNLPGTLPRTLPLTHPLPLPHGRALRTHSSPAAAAVVVGPGPARGGAGGLSLEAVEALEAAARVARDDGGGDALGPVGHPLGGAAVLVRGVVAAADRGALHKTSCTRVAKSGATEGQPPGLEGRMSQLTVTACRPGTVCSHPINES